MNKTAQLIAAVLIVAFVIERVTATVEFFLDDMPPEARRRKIGFVVLGGVLAAAAVWLFDLRLLRDGMQITKGPDALLTWLVIVAGADRIRGFIASPGASEIVEPPETPPIKIIIEESDGKVREVHQSR
jgi:hypothetical protein